MSWKNKLINLLLIIFLIISSGVMIDQLLQDNRNIVVMLSSITFSIAFLLSLILFNRTALRKEEKYIIRFDEESISVSHPEKPGESVKWKLIDQVVINTTDKGPDEPYIWILLATEKGTGCVFPLGAKNGRAAIEKIIGFPGLNLELWAKALNSTENNRFIVWKK